MVPGGKKIFIRPSGQGQGAAKGVVRVAGKVVQPRPGAAPAASPHAIRIAGKGPHPHAAQAPHAAPPPRAAAPAPAAAPKVVHAEDAVERAERAEKVKDYLLATLAADLRQPLAALAFEASQLASAPTAEGVARLAEGARLAVETLDDVMDLADFDGGGIRCDAPADIPALVDETMEMFRGQASAKGVTLKAKVDSMPLLSLNVHRLRLVLRALVDNAVKFTQAGRIGVIATYFGGRLKITVEDTGCGIPLKEQRRFAEAGVERHRAGTLPSGLAVIESLVISMDGDLSLKSSPGIGTVISILFSNVGSAGAAPTQRLSSMQNIGAIVVQDQLPWKAKFLLVDPSPVHNAAMDELLKEIGFENITMVSSGNEALVRLMTGDIDIVLTELALPQTDGIALVREIRNTPAFAKIPVYAVTADDSIVDNFKELGFDGYVLKPITNEKLRSVLG